MKLIIEDFYGNDEVLLSFPKILGKLNISQKFENIIEKNGFNIADFQDDGAVRVQAVEQTSNCISLIENLIKEYL